MHAVQLVSRQVAERLDSALRYTEPKEDFMKLGIKKMAHRFGSGVEIKEEKSETEANCVRLSGPSPFAITAQALLTWCVHFCGSGKLPIPNRLQRCNIKRIISGISLKERRQDAR